MNGAQGGPQRLEATRATHPGRGPEGYTKSVPFTAHRGEAVTDTQVAVRAREAPVTRERSLEQSWGTPRLNPGCSTQGTSARTWHLRLLQTHTRDETACSTNGTVSRLTKRRPQEADHMCHPSQFLTITTPRGCIRPADGSD